MLINDRQYVISLRIRIISAVCKWDFLSLPKNSCACVAKPFRARIEGTLWSFDMEYKFEELIHRWEEHELFYRDLYMKKQGDPAAYQEYLKSLDVKDLQNRGLTVPELFAPFSVFGEYSIIFPLAADLSVWKHSRYTPSYYHSHEYIEVVCVMEGRAVNRFSETESYEMVPGDIIILPDGTRHALEVFSDDGIVLNIMLKKSTFETAFFDILSNDNLLSNFFQGVLRGENRTPYLYFSCGGDPEIRKCIERMFLEYYCHRHYYEMIEKSLVICLFSLLLRDADKYLTQGEKDIRYRIYQYLHKSFVNTSLEEAANAFGYRPAYFSRLVRRETGRSFTELLTAYRMQMACRLLLESNIPIYQISEIVGYQSLEHFNRTFKAQKGMPPSEFRKTNRK